MRYQRILSVFSAIRCIAQAHIKSKIDWKKVNRRQMPLFSALPPGSSSSTSIDAFVDDGESGGGFQTAGSTFADNKRIHTHCNDFLCTVDGQNVSSRYGLVMVNSETMDAVLAKQWWSICDYKICADGGANRLYDGLACEASRFIPDMVKGDLDSLRDDVKQFYTAAGCAVVLDRDQDHNDLDKCLQTLQQRWHIDNPPVTTTTTTTTTAATAASDDKLTNTKPTTVIILGAFGGRFDQEIASVHALYKWGPSFSRIVLVGGGNVARLLTPGAHRVDPVVSEGPVCALLPVGGVVRSITTRGLQWDMAGQRMELGGLISSSNSLLPVGEEGSDDTTTTTGTAISDTDKEMIVDVARPSTGVSGGSRKGYQSVYVETSDPVLWMTTAPPL
jgi:thiamine pyrophosphokinase